MKELKKKVGVIVFILLTTLIGLEIGAWCVLWWKDQKLSNVSERHIYAPIRGHALNPDYVRRNDTNNEPIHSVQGLRRDTLVEVPKPRGVIRILAMGASTLYGLGVQGPPYPVSPTLRNDQTITHYLEKSLNETYGTSQRRFEVINAAVTAYHSYQHVLYFIESLYQYQSDFVIFLDGNNDFYLMDAIGPAARTAVHATQRLVPSFNERTGTVTAYALFRFFGRFSGLAKMLEKIAQKQIETNGAVATYESPREKADTIEQRFDAAARLTFLQSYTLMKALGKYHGFGMHVFLQPQVIFEDRSVLSPRDKQTMDMTVSLSEEKASNMRQMREFLPGRFKKADIPFTDLGQIGSAQYSGEIVYLDYCHLTELGSKIVAGKILPILVQSLGLGTVSPVDSSAAKAE